VYISGEESRARLYAKWGEPRIDAGLTWEEEPGEPKESGATGHVTQWRQSAESSSSDPRDPEGDIEWWQGMGPQSDGSDSEENDRGQ
jgi:hypothetical protein